MNILVISRILNIPSVLPDNDFIYHLYENYTRLFKGSNVVIIYPVKYDFNIVSIIKGRTRLQKLNHKLRWIINDFQVEIFPYFAAWRIRNLHALVSRSIYYLNKNRINNLFKHHKFDIVHARFIFADGMLAYQISRKYRVPYVVSTHDELFYFKHFYSRKMAFKILRNATYVLPVSHVNMMFFKSHGITQVSQIPHGIYDSFIKPQRNTKNRKVRILTICRLLKYKNVDKVILALNQLKDTHDFDYTLIGMGPEKEYLQELVYAKGLKELVNFIDEIPYEHVAEEMYQYDIFILPSYFEAFGRVYFEAMAMGIPIICAKESGIYGLFKENVEGLAVDHTNIQEIVRTLGFLIDNREERLEIGINGQKLVKSYTWENIARTMHQTYLDCITTQP